MSLLPVNNRIRNTGRRNEVIRNLNRQLKELAQAEGAEFLDIHSLMTDSDGRLRDELTDDGIHLNGRGYIIWRDALLPHLNR
jgi:lysophospholipase L1-like esterase